MEIRINGRRALTGEIRETQRGPWTARIEVDEEDADLAGAVTITMGSTSFLGTAKGAVESGRAILRIVGGVDGLKKQLDAKYYYQTSMSVVLNDLMRATGEVLDAAESDPVVTSTRFTRWARLRGEARLALNQLAGEVGGLWRVSRGGGVVMRKDEEWAPVTMKAQELRRDPARGALEIAPEEEPLARPGVTWNGNRIVEATTTWDGGSIRQALTLEAADRARGMAAAITDAAKRANQAALDYSQWYPARVVSQDSDGSVQVYADDERIRGNGITHVPLRHGLPGCTVRVVPGEKVVLFFENGDAKLPAAGLWPDGSSVESIEVQAQQKVVISAPEVLIGGNAAAHAIPLGDMLDTLLRTLSVSTAMGPSGPPITTPVWEQYLSTKHKLDG